MIEIEDLESAATATYDVIVQPGVGFRVMGSSSERYAQAKRAIEIANIKAYAAMKTQTDLATDTGAAAAAEHQDRWRMAVIDACVVDWFGFKSKGKDVPFSAEALKRVLKAKPHWADLLVREIENDANFMKG